MLPWDLLFLPQTIAVLKDSQVHSEEQVSEVSENEDTSLGSKN